jgi:hypothetical protein
MARLSQVGVATSVRIKLRRVLLPSLREAHRIATSREVIPFESFLGEIVEAFVADYRATKAGHLHPLGLPATNGLPNKSRRNGKGEV